MALIDCPECGGNVSDKAVACPHCGAPPTVLIDCFECGDKVGMDAMACPHCGAPTAVATPTTDRHGVAHGAPVNVTPVTQPIEEWTSPSRWEPDDAKSDERPATTADKILCFLLPFIWLIVRFYGGRTGAGPYALAGIGLGLVLRLAEAC